MDTCEFVEYYDWLYRTTRNDIMRDLILETILLMDFFVALRFNAEHATRGWGLNGLVC